MVISRVTTSGEALDIKAQANHFPALAAFDLKAAGLAISSLPAPAPLA